MTNLADHPRRLLLSGLLALLALTTGCGVGTVSTETAGPLVASGSVQGGLQPISGAQIQLFAVGSGGNGTAATSLLTSPVYTDSHSYFSLTGDYTCPSSSTQVYLVARGGNPGYTTPVNNTALVLMAALGSCGDLLANPNRFISINEVTTVAAAYALAQFTTAYDHVSSSATNSTGITNAFLDAALLSDTTTGRAATLPSTLSIESGKLYALADAIVPCVNSDGGSNCNALFAAATINGTAPTNTLSALLNIVKNPAHNIAAIYNLVSSTPPYPTTLSSAPHDWTMSLKVTGGGLVAPTVLALDRYGNVWVTNYGDTPATTGLVGFSPQGSPLAGSPFGVGRQGHSFGLTIDKNNDIWVSSQDNVQSGSTYGSIAKFSGAASSNLGGYVGQYTDASVSQPESISADPTGNGTILVGNYHNGLVSFFNLDGSFNKALGDSSANGPNGINAVVSDGAGGAWAGDQGDGYIFHLQPGPGGTSISTPINCCNGVQTLALDPGGNVWATNYFPVGLPPSYTFSELAPSGSITIRERAGAGLFSPGGAAIDAGGQFWVANHYSANGANSGEFAEVAGNFNSAAAVGTMLTPASGLGLDSGMSLAYAVAPDASGNLWISVNDGDSLRMFFGLTTPTATPSGLTPQAP